MRYEASISPALNQAKAEEAVVAETLPTPDNGHSADLHEWESSSGVWQAIGKDALYPLLYEIANSYPEGDERDRAKAWGEVVDEAWRAVADNTNARVTIALID